MKSADPVWLIAINLRKCRRKSCELRCLVILASLFINKLRCEIANASTTLNYSFQKYCLFKIPVNTFNIQTASLAYLFLKNMHYFTITVYRIILRLSL